MAEKIVVTSQYLREKQQEWITLLGRAQENLLEAAMDTERLRQHFWGNPARRLQGEFISLGKEGMEAFGRMKTHLRKLEEIASVYEDAERRNVDVAADH